MGEKFILSTAYGVDKTEYKMKKETSKKLYIVTDDYDNKQLAKLSEDTLELLQWLNDNFNVVLGVEEIEEADIPEF